MLVTLPGSPVPLDTWHSHRISGKRLDLLYQPGSLQVRTTIDECYGRDGIEDDTAIASHCNSIDSDSSNNSAIVYW